MTAPAAGPTLGQAATGSRRIGGVQPAAAAPSVIELRRLVQSLQIEVRDLRAEIALMKQADDIKQHQREKAKEMAENTAIKQYGSREELTMITERVKLNDAAETLDEKAVRLVAQVSYMTGWIPFLDFHAFKHKGKVHIMPDYKRLVQDSDPGNLSWSFRPMTPEERKSRFVDSMQNADRIVGVVCELVEISKAKELSAAGLAHLYKPIMGYATVNLDVDQTLAHRDPMKRGEIRALRDALNQTAKGQQAQDHFRDLLKQASNNAELPAPVFDDETGMDAVRLAPEIQPAAIEGAYTEAAPDGPPMCASCQVLPADPDSPFDFLCTDCSKKAAAVADAQ